MRTTDIITLAHEIIVDRYRETVSAQEILAKDIAKDEAYTWPEHYLIIGDDEEWVAEEIPVHAAIEEFEVAPEEAIYSLGAMSYMKYPPGEETLTASTIIAEGHRGSLDSIRAQSQGEALDALKGLGIDPKDIADERCVTITSVTPTGDTFVSFAPLLDETFVKVGQITHVDAGREITTINALCAKFWQGRLSAVDEF